MKLWLYEHVNLLQGSTVPHLIRRKAPYLLLQRQAHIVIFGGQSLLGEE